MSLAVAARLVSLVIAVAGAAITFSDSPDPFVDGCGRVARVLTANNHWPWLAQFHVMNDDGQFQFTCNAVLINTRWLLTAAHCLVRPRQTLVHLGGWRGSSEHRVKGTLLHPDYQWLNPRSKYHDIGLIELEEPVNMTESVSPVCLPWEDAGKSLVGRSLMRTAYGTLRHDTEVILQVAGVTILPSRECSGFTQLAAAGLPEGITESNFVCSGKPRGKTSACLGSSGAPQLYQNTFRSWTIASLVTLGRGCDIELDPDLSMPVNQELYLNWIRNKAFADEN